MKLDNQFFKNLAETHYGTQLNVSKLPYGDVMFALLELEQTIANNITVCENLQKDYLLEDNQYEAIQVQAMIETWQKALEYLKDTQSKLLSK